MNKAILCGRATRDAIISGGTDGKTKVARYTIAVDRGLTKEQKDKGYQAADFISCVCFGKPAEFAEKYIKKGTKILIEGQITTGSYTNREGQKVYTTDVNVYRHEFVEGKSSGDGSVPPAPVDSYPTPKDESEDDFMSIPEEDGELPF